MWKEKGVVCAVLLWGLFDAGSTLGYSDVAGQRRINVKVGFFFRLSKMERGK